MNERDRLLLGPAGANTSFLRLSSCGNTWKHNNTVNEIPPHIANVNEFQNNSNQHIEPTGIIESSNQSYQIRCQHHPVRVDLFVTQRRPWTLKLLHVDHVGGPKPWLRRSKP